MRRMSGILIFLFLTACSLENNVVSTTQIEQQSAIAQLPIASSPTAGHLYVIRLHKDLYVVDGTPTPTHGAVIQLVNTNGNKQVLAPTPRNLDWDNYNCYAV